MVRVAVQQFSQLGREALVTVLRGQPDLAVVGQSASVDDLMGSVTAREVDVVVLEADHDDGGDGLARLARWRPKPRLVGLYSGQKDKVAPLWPPQRSTVLVSRRAGIADVLAAVRGAAAEPRLVALPAPRGARGAEGLLTLRELEVLALIARGMHTKEVGNQLGISPKTVEKHKQRLFTKLGVQSQSHAVAIALRRNLLSPLFDRQQPTG